MATNMLRLLAMHSCCQKLYLFGGCSPYYLHLPRLGGFQPRLVSWSAVTAMAERRANGARADGAARRGASPHPHSPPSRLCSPFFAWAVFGAVIAAPPPRQKNGGARGAGSLPRGAAGPTAAEPPPPSRAPSERGSLVLAKAAAARESGRAEALIFCAVSGFARPPGF